MIYIKKNLRIMFKYLVSASLSLLLNEDPNGLPWNLNSYGQKQLLKSRTTAALDVTFSLSKTTASTLHFSLPLGGFFHCFAASVKASLAASNLPKSY